MSMDKNNPDQSNLTQEFEVKHGGLEIMAKCSNNTVAVGKALILENDRIEPSMEEKAKTFGMTAEALAAIPQGAQDKIKEDFISREMQRLSDARDRTIATYEKYLENVDDAMIEIRETMRDSMFAETQVVKDPSILKDMIAKVNAGKSAEVAIDDSYEERITMFKAMPDPSLAKFATELGQHRATMQHHLHPDKKVSSVNDMQQGNILVVKGGVPLHAISSFYDPETGERLIGGIITDSGSLESHAAILVSAMGIPYCRLPNPEDIDRLRNDEEVIISGGENKLLVEVNKTTKQKYVTDSDQQKARVESLLNESQKRKSVQTIDGQKVNVHANFAMSFEAKGVKEANPAGVGLYRTEIIAGMLRKLGGNAMKPDDWAMVIKNNIDAMGGIGTTVRTLDFDGDKGLGIDPDKRAEKQDVDTKVQLRGLALLQQAMEESGKKSKLKIMIPMVSSNEDMTYWQNEMNQACDEVGIKPIKLGCMIETPSAVEKAKNLDTAFMSVGSNDLIHSLLGIDRYHAESLKKYDPTDSTVLNALRHVTKTGADKNIPVSLCGNMASHPKNTALLIGSGIRNLSAGISSIPVVKEMVKRIDSHAAEDLVEQLSKTESRAEREEILSAFNKDLGLCPEGKIDMNWNPSQDQPNLSR